MVEGRELRSGGASAAPTSLDGIFTAAELAVMREALDGYRSPGAHLPGRWMVSRLNPCASEAPPRRVRLRDITLRTADQLPNASLADEGRLELLRLLVEAGIDQFSLSAFRRNRSTDQVRAEVELVKSAHPDGRAIFGNANTEADLALAHESGLDLVEVWSAVYLGAAIPVSAGAVYHRSWQDRDWRDLRFPSTPDQHLDRVRRLIDAGHRHGVGVTAVMNLAAFADEEYVAWFCRAMAEAGAAEVSIADSTGGLGPEAFGRLVSAAVEAAPSVAIGVHAHNAVGLGIANCAAGAMAGAAVVEVAVNGYEIGPGGSQAPLAAAAVALEAVYGASTGIDLTRLAEISDVAARLIGYPIPWNEPLVGSSARQLALPDEYVMELELDELIHSSVSPAAVGARRQLLFSMTSGPFGLARRLAGLGFAPTKDEVDAVLAECRDLLRSGTAIDDDRLRSVAGEIVGSGARADVTG